MVMFSRAFRGEEHVDARSTKYARMTVVLVQLREPLLLPLQVRCRGYGSLVLLDCRRSENKNKTSSTILSDDSYVSFKARAQFSANSP